MRSSTINYLVPACIYFALKSDAFSTLTITTTTRTSRFTSRMPTEVRDSFIDDPVLLNLPTMNTSSNPIHVETRVNNRHSSRDWIHNVSSIPRSSVLREIMNPVLSITAWSTFISILHKVMSSMSSPFWNQVAANMCVPTQIHSFLVSSLGLLLVFRTNSAYQRFVVSRP